MNCLKKHPFYILISAFVFVILLIPATILPATPAEIGKRVANNILARHVDYNGSFWKYPWACSYYGVMIFADATNDAVLKNQVIKVYEPYRTGQRAPHEGHVDYNVFGILPFEIYRQTGDSSYLPVPLWLANAEFQNPRPDGLSRYTRFWVDDLYMICSLQAQAYKNTLDPNYINNGTIQILGYAGDVEDLQQPNGLFHHAYDSPFFWSRCNGWAAAAMTETLLAMSEDHPQRNRILETYKRMMADLIENQDADSGLWYQLIDLPNDPRNWLETSGTGMFVFALATGVDQGWLVDPLYRQAAIKGWLGLESHIRADGNVEWICVGTSRGYSLEYYFGRTRSVGDLHGQAAAMWAATAIVRSGLISKADFNIDGHVNFKDFSLLASSWLSRPQDSTWNSKCDISTPADGLINTKDLILFANQWLAGVNPKVDNEQ